MSGIHPMLRPLALVLFFLATFCTADAATGPMFDNLVLVDEVLCGDPGDLHEFAESPTGSSQVQTVLGQPCRVLPNAGDYPKYFAYRLAPGGVLQAGKAYILTLDYPEDQPRSMFVINSGCEQTNGFHTGSTLGDALTPPYVQSNPESVQYPLSGEYETFQMFFHLHDRFFGLEESRDDAVRPYVPADGFWVTVVQFGDSEDPLSAGAAVARIALYEAPDYANYALPLNLPPEDLPRRHLFWREEMSDSVINNTDPTMRGVATDVDWYEYKARLHKFLGMNTFSKDLLEFGHNQGWDSTFYPGGWYNISSHPHRWQEILAMIGDGGYGLDVLPYYEYCGSIGTPPASLGVQRLCLPLTRDDYYTHISWSEKAYCDVTDPQFIGDVTKLLDCTATRVIGGMRPIHWTLPTGLSLAAADCWEWIDFGPDWQNFRIRETWTQARKWHGGPASPFVELYWHHTPTQFLDGGTHVVPPDAIAETQLNFLTKSLPNEYSWQRDVALLEGQEVTPAARYLVFHTPNPVTEAQELAFVGYIAGGDEQLQVLPIAAGGQLRGTDEPWAPADRYFDCQPVLADTNVPYVGAWFRTRVSNWPMSFADAALARFAVEANGGGVPTRAQLIADQMLYADYYDWWLGKRHEFLDTIRNIIRNIGLNDEADVLFTWDTSESGKGWPDFGLEIITDDVPTWTALAPDADMITDLDDALAMGYHLTALTTPVPDWGGWEWRHALPPPDVANYADSDGVMMTYSFNKAYTVGSTTAFDAFRTAGGLAIIRHYCLNENALDENEDSIVGYFVGDMNLAGPYTMMGEARAMANGDPRYIGYLASSSYNRGFPQYVRNFNANFLALPALPSAILPGVTSDAEVVVRAIDAGEYGTYLAVVNTGLWDKAGVQISLPGGATEVVAAATGELLSAPGGVLTLDFYPCELVSLRIGGESGQPQMGDYNRDGVVNTPDYTVWADSFGWTGAPGGHPADGNNDGRVDTVDYVIWADRFGQGTLLTNQPPEVNAGNNTSTTLPTETLILHGSASDDGRPTVPGQLTFAWSQVSGPATVEFSNPDAAATNATFPIDGVYVLRLEAFDGELTGSDEVQVTVHPAPINQPPEVNAGGDQTIQLPANVAMLNGTATDDGLPSPPSAMTFTWSQISGPGTAEFATPNAEDTQVTLDAPGVYVLRLSVWDGELTTWDEVQVTMNEAPEPGQSYVITPVAWGPAVGSGYIPATGAFDAQPIWDPINETPVGDEPEPHADTQTYYPERFWYIDFGPNYAEYRIHATWTRYRPWSAGDQPGFAGLWWDDDNDTENDNGFAETRFNLNVVTNLPGVDIQMWILNSDVSAAPVQPLGRYLIISTGPTPPRRANEFAILGTYEPAAPLSMQSGLAPATESEPPVEVVESAAPATAVQPAPAGRNPAATRRSASPASSRRARLAETREKLRQRLQERRN